MEGELKALCVVALKAQLSAISFSAWGYVGQ